MAERDNCKRDHRDFEDKDSSELPRGVNLRQRWKPDGGDGLASLMGMAYAQDRHGGLWGAAGFSALREGLVRWIIMIAAGIALVTLGDSQIRAQSPDVTRVPVTDCDKLAAHPLDPDRTAVGIPFEKINADLAIPACKAAVRQHPNSLRLIFQLGRAYSENKNFGLALVQYRRAANLGYAPAQTAMGVAYQNGEGVQKDSLIAFSWYRKAADLGYAPAQTAMGVAYQNGDGVPKDEARANTWFRKAAEQGDASAQYLLGYRYQKGAETNVDVAAALAALDEKLAVYWFRKAAAQGLKEAQEALASMQKNSKTTEELPRYDADQIAALLDKRQPTPPSSSATPSPSSSAGAPLQSLPRGETASTPPARPSAGAPGSEAIIKRLDVEARFGVVINQVSECVDDGILSALHFTNDRGKITIFVGKMCVMPLVCGFRRLRTPVPIEGGQ